MDFTVEELIKQLQKFNPDGKMIVRTHYEDNEPTYNDVIDRITIEEDDQLDGKLVVLIHTSTIY